MLPKHSLLITSRSAAATPSLKFALGVTSRHLHIVPVQVSDLSPRGKSAAFTLIELLVVIAIIAILAGLAFPAVQGAMGSARKSEARNDVSQLASAVKAFQLEYGRLPGTATADREAPPDLITTLTSSNSQNPRGIVFFEPKIAKTNNRAGLDRGVYRDPWGTAYNIILDYDYNNRIVSTNKNGRTQTNFTTVVVTSYGPDKLSAPADNISNVD